MQLLAPIACFHSHTPLAARHFPSFFCYTYLHPSYQCPLCFSRGLKQKLWQWQLLRIRICKLSSRIQKDQEFEGKLVGIVLDMIGCKQWYLLESQGMKRKAPESPPN
ncbi:hypothetical protein BDR03DRAFT_43837 [Suillus americanus]|nr:hypothetical protein BDR03DRAFT_43837 [Suillus americanus]